MGSMPRRATTFVPKRPHKKSRTGCLTCKTKKVKCDEAQPHCSYCTIRNIKCVYPTDPQKTTAATTTTPPSPTVLESDIRIARHANSHHLVTSRSLVPATRAAFGILTKIDTQLLQHYHSVTWRSTTLRTDEHIHAIHRNVLPQIGLAHPYLLFAILGITAAHNNHLRPSVQARNLTDFYRQKTIMAYNRALSRINDKNYESLLITSLIMQCLLPYPEDGETKLWEWVCSFLSMQQGLRVLAMMKWGATIETMSVAPVFQRELKKLPPAPHIAHPEELCLFKLEEGMNGLTVADLPKPNHLKTYTSHPTPPESPEPISHTEARTHSIPIHPQPVSPESSPSTTPPPPPFNQPPPFLPPPLLNLLDSLTNPSIPLDKHAPTLLSALHPLPPIFLSLYHFRLCSDLYTRVVTWPPMLGPDFVALVRNKEPRALIILAWWFALLKMVPNLWWLDGLAERVMDVIVGTLGSWGDGRLRLAVAVPEKVVGVCRVRGREEAVREFWRGWSGVGLWREGEVVVMDD